METNSTQSGNVLFLVLITVTLFAALSYTVTQSTRSVGNAGDENEKIQLAQRGNMDTAINSAKVSLQVIGGCQEIEISYETPDGSNINPHAPIDKSCHIFSPGKGGAPIPPPSSDILTMLEGDFDGDLDIDSADILLVANERGGDNMVYDYDNDGSISVLDMRAFVLKCTRPRCAEE